MQLSWCWFYCLLCSAGCFDAVPGVSQGQAMLHGASADQSQVLLEVRLPLRLPCVNLTARGSLEEPGILVLRRTCLQVL